MTTENLGKRYDLQNLPEFMVKELKRAQQNDRDEVLFDILETQFGGAASINELWVALYRKTEKEIQRRLIGAAVRRLVLAKRIQPIPHRKGFYATPKWLEENHH